MKQLKIKKSVSDGSVQEDDTSILPEMNRKTSLEFMKNAKKCISH